MKIVNQGHRILSVPNSLGLIERAGRTCYKSEKHMGCLVNGNSDGDLNPTDIEICAWYDIHGGSDCGMESCEHHSSQEFARRLIRRGHNAMLEFGDVVVKFTTNRGISHELVRHRLSSFAQESTRYVKYSGEIEFIRPEWMSEEYTRAKGAWLSAMEKIESEYLFLLKHGLKPQDARGILPNDLKTEIVMKANFREWRHIFSLRCDKAAHPQMVALMRPLLADLADRVPVVFEDLAERFLTL